MLAVLVSQPSEFVPTVGSDMLAEDAKGVSSDLLTARRRTEAEMSQQPGIDMPRATS